MGTTELHGLLALTQSDLEKARTQPFLGLWQEDDDGDTAVRHCSIDDLNVVRSEYDAQEQFWYFEVELHDDDWANAEDDVLAAFLKELPFLHGRAMVAAREGWKDSVDWIALIKAGEPILKRIVDDEYDDPDLVRMEQARSLVVSAGWDAATRLFEKLQSRD